MSTFNNFGPDLFSDLFGCNTYKCNTYKITGPLECRLSQLLDHGFVADRACCWDKRLEGHELAIVARTYCGDEEIDNPPLGLRCFRLPGSVMGPNELGTAIAVVIVGKSEASESVLSACTSMPADMLAFMVPLSMQEDGYCVALKTGETVNFPVVRLVKI